MPSVEEVMNQRADALKEKYPDLSFQLDSSDTDAGERGLITIMDDQGTPFGYEFIETKGTWKDALDELNETANDGNYTAVIVPDEVLGDMRDLIDSEGSLNIIVLSYDTVKAAIEKLFD